jgi:surface antigen
MTRTLLAAATALSIAFVASFGLTSCANKEEEGTVAGAVIGGIIGNQFGRGGGKVAATFAGAVIGGIVGNAIGKDLDDRDRELARQAEYDAWERSPPGKPVRWRNPGRDHYGEVVPQAYYERSGARCRDFIHTVWIDGRRQQMRGTACRNADGTWTQVG